MIVCKKCGVELEDNMNICPLCEEPTDDQEIIEIHSCKTGNQIQFMHNQKKMNRPQKKLIWEIISITILSFVVVTLSINLILSGKITWSEYPVSFFLVIFSYISIFTFIDQKITLKLIGGFVAASLFLIIIDAISGGLIWAIKLGIPLLFSGNVIMALLLLVIHKSKQKGINLIAYSFIALALYLLCIEAIVSFFRTGSFHLLWSIIILACVLPVSFVLFFVHYRLTKTRSLERMFHL